jgi:hypothetical protein
MDWRMGRAMTRRLAHESHSLNSQGLTPLQVQQHTDRVFAPNPVYDPRQAMEDWLRTRCG